MSRELDRENFITSLTSLVKIQDLLDDRFFSAKFKSKISKLTADFLAVQSGNKPSVTQCNLQKDFITSIDAVLELMNDLSYLQLLNVSPLFLQATKLLLTLRLDTMKNSTTDSSQPMKDSVSNSKRADQQIFRAEKKSLPRSDKLNKSKQKILDFIRSYPDKRTKDIINEFNVLSDRSVKRNLTELLHNGLVKKRVDNKAVYYSAINSVPFED